MLSVGRSGPVCPQYVDAALPWYAIVEFHSFWLRARTVLVVPDLAVRPTWQAVCRILRFAREPVGSGRVFQDGMVQIV